MSVGNVWVKEVIYALTYLGGKASLGEIYDFIEKNSSINLYEYKDWKSRVRKNIYLYSSDTEIFTGEKNSEKDIFYPVKEIGEGIWGLRYENNKNDY